MKKTRKPREPRYSIIAMRIGNRPGFDRIRSYRKWTSVEAMDAMIENELRRIACEHEALKKAGL